MNNQPQSSSQNPNHPGNLPASPAGGQAKKSYILVAEDDRFYASIYKTKLTKEGYEVVVTGDGEQVLKAARERKPDLILLDLVMPVKDGFETLKELKSDSNLADIKVVVLSNLGQEEDIKRTREMGVVDYLVKTNMSIQEMIDKVKSYLE